MCHYVKLLILLNNSLIRGYNPDSRFIAVIMLVSKNQNYLWKDHRLSIASNGEGGILCHKNVMFYFVSYCFVFV